ncbi:MAG: hypothetical protein C5B49_03600 [Bdellovibrio sp.]|nr:MAG: hypothetical protein C5B49_03600 [Bdellovibrio sp.]
MLRWQMTRGWLTNLFSIFDNAFTNQIKCVSRRRRNGNKSVGGEAATGEIGRMTFVGLPKLKGGVLRSVRR